MVSEYAKEAIGGQDPGKGNERPGRYRWFKACRLWGLPCPNIFTGEMAFHGKHEYVSIQDMQKSVETIVNLVMIWEEKAAG